MLYTTNTKNEVFKERVKIENGELISKYRNHLRNI